MALFKEDPIQREFFNRLNPEIDSSELSQDFFVVKDFPSFLTQGYNSFRINPEREKFQIGADIRVYAEAVIFEQPIQVSFPDIDFGNGDILVSLKLPQDFPQDLVRIQVLSTKADGEFIMWERTLSYEKATTNNSPLLYENTPLVNIREVVKFQLTESFLEGGTNLYVTQSNLTSGTDIINNVSSSVQLDVRADGDSFLLANGFNFTESMAQDGAYVQLQIPSSSLPLFDRFYSLTGSNIVTASLNEFIGASALKISSVTRDIDALDVNHKYFSFQGAGYNIIYPKTLAFLESSTNTQKYFRFEFIKTVPVSGFSKFAKIEFQKETDANPQLLTIAELVPNEFLVDSSSLSLNYRIGVFDTASKAPTYWETFFRQSAGVIAKDNLTWSQISASFSESEVVYNLGYAVPEVIDDVTAFDFTSTLGNAVVLGNNIVDYSPDESYLEFRPVTESWTNGSGIEKIAKYFDFFYKGVPYELSFEAFTQKNLGSGFNNPKLEVYLDGFAFRKIGGASFGEKVLELESINQEQTYLRQKVVFTPFTNGKGFPRFIVRSGQWYLKNISIKAYTEERFSPGHTYLYIPVPTELTDTSVDFLIDFLNEENVGTRIL